jgi:DNA-binding NarL/FixJ family response regulator
MFAPHSSRTSISLESHRESRMSRTRVAIADDHPVVREGLKRIISECADLEVVGEAASQDDVEALCLAQRPDVLLLDISMPGPGFLEVLRRLRARGPKPAVVVLSMYAEAAFACRAVEAGAWGYLSKQDSSLALTTAIRRAAAGEVRSAGSRGSRAAPGGRSAAGGPLQDRLSPREFQLFLLLGRGHRVSEIARQLGLSPKTVSTHRARILEKTGLRSNAEIVRYVAATAMLD